jgi:Protein of unknown function (DUF2911)
MTTTPKATIAACALVLATAAVPATRAMAQVELPRESPLAKVSQQVGLTEIALEYTSPAVKGRRIWGDLVPYDRPWPISSSHGTIIRFSKDVVVGDKPVAAGTYRLYAIPGKESWSFILNKASAQADSGRDFGFDASALRVKAQTKASPFRERLTFLFSDFTDNKASLDLEWDKLRVSISIATNTAQQVLAGINELDSVWRSYANAARFMLETKKDYDAGLVYANESLALKEDWYTLWIKAALLAAKRDYRGAVDEGERAYQLGQQLGDGFVLEPELKKALTDWKKRR